MSGRPTAERTVGIEEEFLLMRDGTPHLVAAGEAVVAHAESGSTGQFEHELMREQAELGTEPHDDIAALGVELRKRRAELGAAAQEHGARLLAAGTSPLDQQVSTTREDRYERMTETFGLLARVQLTCGMHVHVSVESPEEGVAVLDRIRGWLPALIALSANSPFFAGQDTGYASYRTVVWGQWPSAGPTEPFGSIEEYERARDALVATGAAIDAGMLYFDARLSARYPTVEVRVCDVCADARDATVLAALVRALVSTAAVQAADGVPVPAIRGEMLRAARWRAARWGMEEQLVDPHTGELLPAWALIERLFDLVEPALTATGDESLVRDGLARIRDRGTGARLQRIAHQRGGFAAAVDAVAEQTLSL